MKLVTIGSYLEIVAASLLAYELAIVSLTGMQGELFNFNLSKEFNLGL